MSQAVVWAKAQDVGNPVAKAVLVCLASWADADDEAWASVPTMALELERSERTIQRGIAWLLGKRGSAADEALAPRFIFDTGRKKLTKEGKFIPVYGFALDQGPANTKVRLAVEKARKAEIWGDTGVTPENLGCQPGQVWGDSGDKSGVTPVSPKEGTRTLGELKEARPREAFAQADGVGGGEEGDGGAIGAGFERVWAAWKAAGIKDGLARPFDWAAWVAACEAMSDPAGLERAALNYLAHSPAVKRGRGKSLAKWLAEEGWRQWAPVEAAVVEAATFDAPGDVMAMLAANRQRDWPKLLASQCRWDGAARALICRTDWLRGELTREFGRDLRRLEITLVKETP